MKPIVQTGSGSGPGQPGRFRLGCAGLGWRFGAGADAGFEPVGQIVVGGLAGGGRRGLYPVGQVGVLGRLQVVDHRRHPPIAGGPWRKGVHPVVGRAGLVGLGRLVLGRGQPTGHGLVDRGGGGRLGGKGWQTRFVKFTVHTRPGLHPIGHVGVVQRAGGALQPIGQIRVGHGGGGAGGAGLAQLAEPAGQGRRWLSPAGLRPVRRLRGSEPIGQTAGARRIGRVEVGGVGRGVQPIGRVFAAVGRRLLKARADGRNPVRRARAFHPGHVFQPRDQYLLGRHLLGHAQGGAVAGSLGERFVWVEGFQALAVERGIGVAAA